MIQAKSGGSVTKQATPNENVLSGKMTSQISVRKRMIISTGNGCGCEKDKQPPSMALTASSRVFMYSGATLSVMKDLFGIYKKAVLLDITIETAGKGMIKEGLRVSLL